jgi:branched-chain amino acid transport system substrate-binding protein
VIDDATAYGEGLANEVEKTLKAAGVKVLPREKGTDKTVDWKAVLTKVKGKKPDAMFYGGMDATAGPLLKQARELKMTAVFSFGDGACTDKMAELAGDGRRGPDLLAGRHPGPGRRQEVPRRLQGQVQRRSDHLLALHLRRANLLIAAMKKADSPIRPSTCRRWRRATTTAPAATSSSTRRATARTPR